MPWSAGNRISPIVLPCMTRENSSFVSGSNRNSELRSTLSVSVTTSIRRGNSTSSDSVSDTRLAISTSAAVRRISSVMRMKSCVFSASVSPCSNRSISAW